MSTCYIIDDELYSIEIIAAYVKKNPDLELLGYETDPVKGINDVKKLNPDLVFLDIEMPELSGLEVAEHIGEETKIVFITAHSAYALNAFELNAFDFLLKPFSYNKFLKVIQKADKLISTAKTELKRADDTTFFINPGIKGKMLKLDYALITHIEALKNYVIIYTETDKHITYLSMTDIENSLLPKSLFLRIHKSFIVNMKRIKSIEKQGLITLNNIEIPLGQSYKIQLSDYLISKTIKSSRK